MYIKLLIIALTMFIGSTSLAHKGNPWHGAYMEQAEGSDPSATTQGKLGVSFGTAGLASAKLTPKAQGATTYRFTYRTDVPKLVSSATKLVAGVMTDPALMKGAVSNDGIVAMKISDSTANYKSVEFEFKVSEPGIYHFFFGPWDGVTLYLGEDPPVILESDAGDVEWISKVAGDVSIATNPELDIRSQPGLVVWVQQIFDPAVKTYEKFDVAHLSMMRANPTETTRMNAIHSALTKIGLRD